MFSAVSFFSKLPPASLPPTAPILAGELWKWGIIPIALGP
ncbi:hypothetical protein SLEP1_g16760 [Rubroshorea leprosula]|uniref:Uncharacterized protein n=1 Tax=Rubroshorea leprosula TaxID=152421 RepID=A0AAV5J0Z4_9ROSI|nr:hypothetical protein SLEP1_g16760 [Rubroshorea leprosula]